jgi:hypothetical protein
MIIILSLASVVLQRIATQLTSKKAHDIIKPTVNDFRILSPFIMSYWVIFLYSLDTEGVDAEETKSGLPPGSSLQYKYAPCCLLLG